MTGQVLSAVRERLESAWPWPAWDFAGVSVEDARRRFARAATRPLPPADDLRIVSTSGGHTIAVLAERLPWDSEFFGYGVGRFMAVVPLAPGEIPREVDHGHAIEALLARARAGGIRYLFGMIDARDTATLRALGTSGFSLIETRVIYHRSVRDFAAPERHAVRAATAGDLRSLARTARESVNPYDRFRADPFIAAADADRLMETWVEASLARGFADITLVPDQVSPTAFNALRYHRDLSPSMGQVVLSAVGPESRGWYRKLMSETTLHFREVGLDRAYVTTQVTNGAVIHVLESLGYRFGRCEHVLRRLP